MTKLTRRRSLTLLAFSPLAAWGSENQPAAAPAPQHAWAEIAPREMIRQRYFPDVVLRTQENKEVQLYRDLIKDKVMLINFMFTSCNGICPRVTQNLVKVQKLLGSRMGKDIFIYSFTLDPNHDTPQALKEFATLHRVGPGWSFLTGNADELEMLRRRLGFTDPDPEQDRNRDTHIGNVRYGNEARLLWGACPGMSRPEFIVESLSWVDSPKTPHS